VFQGVFLATVDKVAIRLYTIFAKIVSSNNNAMEEFKMDSLNFGSLHSLDIDLKSWVHSLLFVWVYFCSIFVFQSDLPYEFCYLRVDKYCSLSAYLNQLEWWDPKGTLLSCQYSLMAERIFVVVL